MTVKIWIPHKFPGLNDYVNAERRNRFLGNKMKQENQEIATYYIQSNAKRKRFQNPVWCIYTWHESTKRRDKDNVAAFGRKVIQDALVTSHVLENDGWKNILGFTDRFVYDKDNPGVELTITDEVDDG